MVRREDLLRTGDGRRLGKYVVRLGFHAGIPGVHVQHSFVVTEDTSKVQFSDPSFRLQQTGKGKTGAWFATDVSAVEPLHIDLDRSAGDAAYLLQAEYPHHGQKTSRREMKVRREPAVFDSVPLPAGDASKPAEAGNWMAVGAEKSLAGIKTNNNSKLAARNSAAFSMADSATFTQTADGPVLFCCAS